MSRVPLSGLLFLSPLEPWRDSRSLGAATCFPIQRTAAPEFLFLNLQLSSARIESISGELFLFPSRSCTNKREKTGKNERWVQRIESKGRSEMMLPEMKEWVSKRQWHAEESMKSQQKNSGTCQPPVGSGFIGFSAVFGTSFGFLFHSTAVPDHTRKRRNGKDNIRDWSSDK